MVFGLLTGLFVGFAGFLLSFIEGIYIGFDGTASLIILTGFLAWFGSKGSTVWYGFERINFDLLDLNFKSSIKELRKESLKMYRYGRFKSLIFILFLFALPFIVIIFVLKFFLK
jgi:hypothetical protein